MPTEPDLYRALRTNDLRRVRECLHDWGNENKRVWWTTGSGRTLTPLHVASKGSNQDILQELLKHPDIGRSINTFTGKTNVTPLHEAAGSSSPEVVRILLDAGADLASSSGNRSTAFHISCSRGRLETCMELLRRGSLLEGRDAEGMTPLLRAVLNGRSEVVEWLLSEGADPAAVDIYNNTALALGCRATTLDSAWALLDFGVDIVAKNANGDCCVTLAAISGRTELLDMMLTAMASSGQRFRDGGGDMLYAVVDHGLANVLALLTNGRGRELGININRRNASKQGTTPLHAACFRGQHGVVGQLLSRGAAPDIGDNNGLRSLHVACASPLDSRPIVKSLLQANADANIIDAFGCSPIYYAFVRGNDEIVWYMLSRGASLFRMDYDQALRIACFFGMVVEVESLLWMEADPNSVLQNHHDRGNLFHPSVNSAVREGVNQLLAENSTEENVGDRRSVDGATELAAVREISAALRGGKAGSMSLGGATRSVSSGWTSDSDFSEDDFQTNSVVASSVTNTRGRLSICLPEADDNTPTPHRGGFYARIRQSIGLARNNRILRQSFSLASDEISDNDQDSEENFGGGDDAFVIPSMFSFENDLIQVIEANGNGTGESSTTPTGATAALKRWGQRVRGRKTAGGRKDNGAVPNSGAGIGGAVKEKAVARMVDAVKWMSPRGNRGGGGDKARGFAVS